MDENTTNSTDTPRHAAPTPQDRLLPTTKGPQTVTIDGITVTVDPRRFSDFRVIDEMYDITYNNGGLKIVGLLRRLLGQEQYGLILDQLADQDGVVDPEKVNRFLTQLFGRFAPNS